MTPTCRLQLLLKVERKAADLVGRANRSMYRGIAAVQVSLREGPAEAANEFMFVRVMTVKRPQKKVISK